MKNTLIILIFIISNKIIIANANEPLFPSNLTPTEPIIENNSSNNNIVTKNKSSEQKNLDKNIEENQEINNNNKDNNDIKSYKLNQYDSLFFSNDQIDRLKIVKDAVDLGVEVQENFDEEDLEQQEEQIVKRNTINFYLNSIIYYNKNDWSIWVNGSKINKEYNSTDLELLSVTEKVTKFKWTTGYGKFVETLSRIIDIGEVPDNVYVEITDNIAIVIFSLKPNQSFRLGSSLNIIEGK